MAYKLGNRILTLGNKLFTTTPVDLLYHWQFEDNLTDSVKGLTLTNAGAFSYQTGKVGKGVRTDANNTWFYTTDTTLRAALGGYNSFTISCWFYLTTTIDRFQTCVFNSTRTNSGNNSYYINWDSNRFRFRNRTGSESQISTSPHTGWNHGVIVYDGVTRYSRAYHDGVLRYNALNNSSLTVTNFAWCDYQDWQHNHIVDCGRIYNRAFTQAEVTALFNAGN